jgi:hypothetical protein
MFAKVLAAVALATGAAAQPGIPVLRYQPPPNFHRSSITPPEDFSSNEFDASVQIYPFRSFSGNIEQLFQGSLLRDWIDPRFRETNVIGQPEFRRSTIQGAEAALSAKFGENIAGIPKIHLRMVIVIAGAAAIVDASANNAATWQRALAPLNQMSATMRVESETSTLAITGGPGSAGRAIAGLYMGTKAKYMVNLNRAVGSGSTVTALHYYLFSPDGRVYCAYDELKLPGGDLTRFDFDAARRNDPVNSGRYTVTGDLLRIQMGSAAPITTPLPKNGRLTIETVVYIRQLPRVDTP